MTASEELVARFRRYGLCLECARAVAQAEAEGRDEFETCGECTQILPLLIAGIQLAEDKTPSSTTEPRRRTPSLR